MVCGCQGQRRDRCLSCYCWPQELTDICGSGALSRHWISLTVGTPKNGKNVCLILSISIAITSSCANQQWKSKEPTLIYAVVETLICSIAECTLWSTLQYSAHYFKGSEADLILYTWFHPAWYISTGKQVRKTIIAFQIFWQATQQNWYHSHLRLLLRLVFCLFIITWSLWCDKDTLITTNRVYKLQSDDEKLLDMT